MVKNKIKELEEEANGWRDSFYRLKWKYRDLRIYLFWIAFSVTLLGVIIFLAWFAPHTPNFTITQEKCWNETASREINYPYDFTQVACPSYFTQPKNVSCYDSKGNLMVGETCLESPTPKECYTSEYLNDSILVGEYSGDAFRYFLYNIPNYRMESPYFVSHYLAVYGTKDSTAQALPSHQVTEQRCETKEVDEIIDSRNCAECIPLSQDSSHGYDCLASHRCRYFDEGFMPIKKSNLDERWLNENCECDSASSGTLKPCYGCTTHLKCYKWKCGDYFVEEK